MAKNIFKLRQSEHYAGNEWWDWSVWLDASPKDLEQIDHVEYTLHPTFPKPVRRVADKSTNFRLNTGGWGTFKVRAKAVLKDGQEVPLAHDLKLHYPSGKEAEE